MNLFVWLFFRPRYRVHADKKGFGPMIAPVEPCAYPLVRPPGTPECAFHLGLVPLEWETLDPGYPNLSVTRVTRYLCPTCLQRLRP